MLRIYYVGGSTKKMRQLGRSDGGGVGEDLKGYWAVTVKVVGPELYRASAAFGQE